MRAATGRRSRRDLDRVLALFPRVAQRLEQAAGTLSGGEQQMVAMARALMGRPRLICMDEPTMGLSPLYVDRVLALIETINREGVSVFMVEQNASLALRIADYGYVLQTGRIILHGPARHAFARSAYPRRLSGRRNTERCTDAHAWTAPPYRPAAGDHGPGRRARRPLCRACGEERRGVGVSRTKTIGTCTRPDICAWRFRSMRVARARTCSTWCWRRRCWRAAMPPRRW